MPPAKLLFAPIRRIVGFPLFQFAVTVAVILWLQAAPDDSLRSGIYNELDRLVDFTVQRCGATFALKSFTKSWLTTGFWIAYVYLIGLFILYVIKSVILGVVEVAARHNVFYLRSSVARERGIEAYRAWLPFERIRPAHIPQETWEATYAWPPDNRPPYPPLGHRIVRGAIFYILLIAVIAILLQELTPFPALTWIGAAIKGVVTGN